MDRWMDGWMDGWIDGWMDGWTDGWTDGWMDESIPNLCQVVVCYQLNSVLIPLEYQQLHNEYVQYTMYHQLDQPIHHIRMEDSYMYIHVYMCVVQYMCTSISNGNIKTLISRPFCSKKPSLVSK